MAHKVLEDGRVVVDWTTGDPEGDRITVLAALREFIQEVQDLTETGTEDAGKLWFIFDRWNVRTDCQIDEVPRIWIKRPE